MSRQSKRAVVFDLLPIAARKPCAGPAVTPSEAIAIALSSADWSPGRLHDPDGIVVQLVLKALKDCGWKIEPL